MKSLRGMQELFEKELAATNMSEADKNRQRVRFAERIAIERESRVQALVNQERAAQAGSLPRGIAGSVGAAALNFANEATFRTLPKIVGAVGGDQEKVETAVEVSQRTNPVSSAAGTIGAYVKGTPVRAVSTAASAAGAGTLRAAAKAVGSNAFDQVAMKPFMQRAAARFAENMAGGMASVAAVEGLAAKGDDKTLSQTLHSVTAATAGTAAISALVGGAQARWMRPVSQELAPLFEKYRAATGREIPADIASNDAELQALTAQLQRIPGLAKDVRAVRERLIGGLREILRGNAADAGATTGQTGKAADAVRRLVGSRKDPGPVTMARRGPEEAALAQYAGQTLDNVQHTNFMGAVARITGSKDAADPRGSAMGAVLKDLQKLGAQGPFSIERLEAFRKRLGEIAFTMDPNDVRFASRGRKEASDIYGAVDEALEARFPEYQRALNAASKLRAMEESLSTVRVSDVDEKTVARFWGAENPLQNWEAMKRFGTAEDQAAAKGYLFDSLVRYGKGLGPGFKARLERAFESKTFLNRQVVDQVMPGLSDELLRLGDVLERAGQGILKHPGSDTATAAMRIGNLATNSAGVAAMIAGMFTNPYAVISPILGGAAVRWVVQKNLRSLVNGARGEGISRLAQGQTPPPIGPSAGALNAIGGMGGAAQTGLQGVGAAAGGGAALLRPLVNTIRPQQQPGERSNQK